MTIYCRDMENFMDVIAGCVRRGLKFHADVLDFKVTLTGGY